MSAPRQTLDVMEARDAAHMGLVPVRYANCQECGERLDLATTDEKRRTQHGADCSFHSCLYCEPR